MTVASTDADSFTVTATSKNDTRPGLHQFEITKTNGQYERPYTCNAPGEGGCKDDGGSGTW